MKQTLTAAGITPDNGTTKTRNGPALRYVGAIPATENHNFEEEYLLGEAKITTRQYENDCYRERIEFRPMGVLANFYYLDYYEYDTTPDEYDVYIDPNDANKLIIDLHNKKTSFNSKTELQQVDKQLTPKLVSTKTRTVEIENNDEVIVDTITTADGN